MIGMSLLAGCSSNDNPVKAGKYADFLLVNKDVLSCPVTEIHEARPAATYFEGKKVFVMANE
jgi:predicted amidohydrolase YtcJ